MVAKIRATPIVATDSTRRGARAKRRTISSSTSQPDSAADTMATTNPTTYGTWWIFTNSTAITADTAPISAWAKLMMRLAR